MRLISSCRAVLRIVLPGVCIAVTSLSYALESGLSASSDPALSNVRWELTYWPSHPVPSGDNGAPVILTFNPAKEGGQVYGFAGCGSFAARYEEHALGELSIERPRTTRQACAAQAMAFQGVFLRALPAVAHYRIVHAPYSSLRANNMRLDLMTKDGQTLAFAARPKEVAEQPVP